MRILNRSILPLIILVVIFCASNIQWGKDNWKDILEADAKGYYAYLPAMFIYHDMNFTFFDSIEKKHPNPHFYYDYRSQADGGTVNKYYAGTAVAMSPFFLAAHVFAGDKDGYSKIYMVMVSIAAIFYLFLGLYYLRKLLKIYNVKDVIASFILIAIVFGTNMFYYAVCEPGMSHIYSFAFITMFLYYAHRFFRSKDKKELFIRSLLLGMIILIRPVNGLIFLILPFIAGSRELFLDGLGWVRRNGKAGLFSFLLFFLVIFIQPLIYKVQTGHFWVYSYGSESFNWMDPHLLDFLFSYKKGLFIYTPLAFAALLGMLKLFKESRFAFYSLLLFLIVLLYVLSSWWCWWYGGSFSSRVAVEYYAIAAILLGYSFDLLKAKWSRVVLSVFIVMCILLCQLQTFQYRYYLIHWEKMDKEHYWRVFLELDKIGKENPNADLLNGL